MSFYSQKQWYLPLLVVAALAEGLCSGVRRGSPLQLPVFPPSLASTNPSAICNRILPSFAHLIIFWKDAQVQETRFEVLWPIVETEKERQTLYTPKSNSIMREAYAHKWVIPSKVLGPCPRPKSLSRQACWQLTRAVHIFYWVGPVVPCWLPGQSSLPTFAQTMSAILLR
jgi:hypothetical protein